MGVKRHYSHILALSNWENAATQRRWDHFNLNHDVFCNTVQQVRKVLKLTNLLTNNKQDVFFLQGSCFIFWAVQTQPGRRKSERWMLICKICAISRTKWDDFEWIKPHLVNLFSLSSGIDKLDQLTLRRAIVYKDKSRQLNKRGVLAGLGPRLGSVLTLWSIIKDKTTQWEPKVSFICCFSQRRCKLDNGCNQQQWLGQNEHCVQ